jgi:PAS domain S-box-containing protein
MAPLQTFAAVQERWRRGNSPLSCARKRGGSGDDAAQDAAILSGATSSEDLLRYVLDCCPVPITLNRVDDGRILYESPATTRLLGYKGRHVAKSVLDRWAEPADREGYLQRLREARAVEALEVRFRKADGTVFACAVSSRLLKFRGEDVIVSGLFDLTELRAAQAEVAQQRELLEQSARLSAMGELLAGISHELNNPLSVLVVQAAAMEETATDERSARRASRIARAADRCARIVKSFLAMARQEPAEMLPLDINAIIEDALEITAYSLRTSGIEVTLRLAKSLPAARGDTDQLRQVLTNLLVNAHHALQDIDGPRRLLITTRYRKQDGKVIVKVKDNGPGVPTDIRARVFEPLFTTKEVGVGTGMGLSLCHRIMEGHGGSIALERGHHRGAVFVLKLPCADTLPAPRPSCAPAPRRSAVCRVLVVDDEQDLGQSLAEILEQDGHCVDYVASAATALEKLKRHRYEVILSDIRMPGMDGPSFFRTLRSRHPDQLGGFAFITGDTLTPQLRDFIDSTERPCIEKPFAPRDIRQVVELILRSRSR